MTPPRRLLAALALACAATSIAAPAHAADTTPPTIHLTVPPSQGTGPWIGWYAAPVKVTMSATDDTGVTSLSYEMTGRQTGTGSSTGAPITRDVAIAGVTTLTVRARDAAGNQAERVHGIGLDLTRPTVGFGGTAPNGLPIRRGEVRTLTFACADETTAVMSCTARIGDTPFTSGDPIPTETTGSKSVTVTAIDAVGRRTEQPYTYNVREPLLQVTARPGIEGDPPTVRVGQILTARPPIFEPAAERVTYEWHNGEGEGVAGDTYQVRPVDLLAGSDLWVDATGTRPGYEPTRTSGFTNRVQVVPGLHQVTGAPTVGGRAVDGESLTVTPATVSPSPQAIRTVWTVGGSVQATQEPRLHLTTAQTGQQVRCEQIYTSPGYDETRVPCVFPGGATSVTVSARAWTVLKPATIEGKARVGKRLRAVLPQLSGPAATYAYRWLRNGKPIKGATTAAYKLRKADRKRKITVRVTITSPAGAVLAFTAKPKRIR